MSSTQPNPAAHEPPDDLGGPTLDEMFPPGSRVVVRYQFSTRTIATGTVIGQEEGWIDTGSPESGPGPVVETTLLVIETDDGRTIRVEPGQAEPDEDGEA